jgi:hypothetical protein
MINGQELLVKNTPLRKKTKIFIIIKPAVGSVISNIDPKIMKIKAKKKTTSQTWSDSVIISSVQKRHIWVGLETCKCYAI